MRIKDRKEWIRKRKDKLMAIGFSPKKAELYAKDAWTLEMWRRRKGM